MKKAVIFDFDYTLGDSTSGIVKSAKYALCKLGEEKKSDQEIINTIGLSLEETYKVLSGKDDTEKQKLFKKYFIEKADEVMVASTELYEDSLYVLRTLKNIGIKTAIVTTKLNSRIQSIFKKFDALELIDVIVGVENVEKTKPHPEGLFLALNQLLCEKEDAVYVGDSHVDAKAAENAEIDFIGVLTGTTTKKDFEKYKNIRICSNIKEVFNTVINYREEK